MKRYSRSQEERIFTKEKKTKLTYKAESLQSQGRQIGTELDERCMDEYRLLIGAIEYINEELGETRKNRRDMLFSSIHLLSSGKRVSSLLDQLQRDGYTQLVEEYKKQYPNRSGEVNKFDTWQAVLELEHVPRFLDLLTRLNIP